MQDAPSIRTLAALLLFVSVFGCTTLLAASSAEWMNVLLIISDDLRCELGCYGSQLAKTPRLDQLAATGVRFEHAYCQFPLCNPSRSSMLTGRRPTTIGVLGNRDWFGAEHPEVVSLPKYFKQHGYLTLRSGKIFHGGIDDEEAWSVGARERYFGAGATAEIPGRRRSPATADGRQPRLTKAQRSDRWVVLEGEGQRHGDYRTTTRAIELLREYSDEPFFLCYGLSKPHSPLEAPQRFFDMFDVDQIPLPPDFAPRPTVPEGFPAGSIRPKNADLFIGREATPQQAREMIRAYLASTAYVDWNVGRVLDALEELGLREKTIVLFWGDHGFQLGEKGKWSKAGSLWEQGARVPLVICDPRAGGNGNACPRVVESLDLFPTLVDLCGLPAVEGVEGRSLAPLLADPHAAWNHPAYTIWSEDGEHVTGVAVRTEHWRYAEFYGRGAGAMLTDPQADPHELTNLVTKPQHSEVVAHLSQLARQVTHGHRPHEARELRWRDALSQPTAWYGSNESLRIADNVLLYQHPNGGWGKNVDMARDLSPEQTERVLDERNQTETTIDNGATHGQIQYLARNYHATRDQKYAAAARRGIEYLLDAQYTSGGWPMIYPLKRGYYSHITFNDGAMIGAMRVLRDVARGEEPYGFVDADLQARASAAVERGLEAILQCQIVVDGRKTAWCAQHDEHDFQPRGARSYELPSISGLESVEIVRFLMELQEPSPEVRAAIESAIAWFGEAKIEGIAVRTIRDPSLPRGYDKQVAKHSSAPPMWARFHEIGTNRPMFVGRDGVIREALADIEHERRVGYRWLTRAPAALLERDYPAWKQRVQACIE